MARLRSNFQTGTIDSPGLVNSSSTTITWSGAGPNVSVTEGDYIPIVINPAAYGSVDTTAPEVVWITNYTSPNTTATILRGQEDTTAQAWSTGTAWALAVTKQDFTLSSGIVNGDFPAPTASGQLLTSDSTTNAAWTSNISNVTIRGATINNSTISTGNTFNAGSVPGSALTGAISSSATIGGSQIVGNNSLSISTIASGANNQVLTTSGGSVQWKTPVSANLANLVKLDSGILASNGITVPYLTTYTNPSSTHLGEFGIYFFVGSGTSNPTVTQVMLQAQVNIQIPQPYVTDVVFVFFASRRIDEFSGPDGTYIQKIIPVGIADSDSYTSFNGSTTLSGMTSNKYWLIGVGAYRRSGNWPSGTPMFVQRPSITFLGTN